VVCVVWCVWCVCVCVCGVCVCVTEYDQVQQTSSTPAMNRSKRAD